MNIKRFDLDQDDRISEYHRDGDFVLAEDYNALAAQLAEAERLLREAREIIDDYEFEIGQQPIIASIDAFLQAEPKK